MVLLVIQATLVAAGRTDIHRRLGVAGAWLGLVMMVLGAYVALTRFHAGLMNPPPGIPAGVLLAVALATIVVFPVLFGSALLLRGRPDYHKRLVLIATLELVTAGIARWPGVATFGPPTFFALTDLFLAALIVYDFKTRGRIHPATLWGGLVLVASQPLRLVIGFSAPWAAFASWGCELTKARDTHRTPSRARRAASRGQPGREPRAQPARRARTARASRSSTSSDGSQPRHASVML